MSSKTTFRSVFDVRGTTWWKQGCRPHAISNPLRNELVVILGEFCGTFMFLLMAFVGTQTAINSNSTVPGATLHPSSLFYIASSFGASLAVNVWVFYRVTGGMFNPAVTLGLVLVGAVKPLRALMIFPTQLVAAIAAAAVTDGLIPGPLTVSNNLSDGVSKAQGLFLEMFLTAQLVITIYFLAVEKHRATYLAPIGIGVSAFLAHIAGTNYTGTSINPARSFGPAVITGFAGVHWVFWLGPLLGAVLAFVIYSLLKWLEYQTANPGQDSDDVEKANAAATLAPPVMTGSDSHIHAEVATQKDANRASRHDSVLEGQPTMSGSP